MPIFLKNGKQRVWELTQGVKGGSLEWRGSLKGGRQSGTYPYTSDMWVPTGKYSYFTWELKNKKLKPSLVSGNNQIYLNLWDNFNNISAKLDLSNFTNTAYYFTNILCQYKYLFNYKYEPGNALCKLWYYMPSFLNKQLLCQGLCFLDYNNIFVLYACQAKYHLIKWRY